tara:strand:- start:591 stop:1334 length:744 start_codon:yes stop_codon:yes gene_type:complete
MPGNVRLRVHIAPVGFEIDRVVIPAIEMKADKVYLLRHDNYAEDKSGPYLEKIAKKLDNKNISTEIVNVNRYRLFGIIRVVKEIIIKERDSDIYLNIASGSKIHAVGCMMAAMLKDDRTNIHPYYAQAETYPTYSGKEQQTFGVEEIHDLPTYQIRTPPPKLLEALSIIKAEDRITKKRLAEIADDHDLINVGAREENFQQARFASLDKNIIHPLEHDWEFIKVEKVGRNRIITLTKEGKYAAEFLI